MKAVKLVKFFLVIVAVIMSVALISKQREQNPLVFTEDQGTAIVHYEHESGQTRVWVKSKDALHLSHESRDIRVPWQLEEATTSEIAFVFKNPKAHRVVARNADSQVVDIYEFRYRWEYGN
jgi:hypothetical protein